MPYQLQQQYGEDKLLPGTAAWRLAHPSPFVTGGTYAPGGTNPITGTGFGNTTTPVSQPSTSSGGGFQGDLSKGYGDDMRYFSDPKPQIPTLQPPLGIPQAGQGGGGGSQLKIELPDAFKVNQAIAGPTTIPPLSIRNGITMPAVTPGVKPQSFPSMNWSDMLTVAHMR